MNRLVCRSALAGIAVAVLLAGCGREGPRSVRETAVGPAPDGAGLTVERIFTPPAPDGALLREVTWRPGGEEVAFLAPVGRDSVTGDEVLALFLADPATGERRRVASAGELLGDERQEFGEAEKALRERQRLSALGITAYLWSPDGRRVTIPISGDLYELDVDEGSTRRLTATDAAEFDPRYAPGGGRIAFTRDGSVWVLDVGSGRERRISPVGSDSVYYGMAEFIAQEELGRRRGFWWSPDGSRIAYTGVDETGVPIFTLADYREPYGDPTRQRYPRAGDPNATVRLWVAPSDGGAPVEMDVPSGPDAYLARVAWHPNGTDLVVQVQPRGQDRTTVLLVDSRSGRSRELFVEAEEGDEWVDLHDDMTWLPDGDFLWTSARSGHRHVYRHGPDGAVRHAVTSGEWPVVSIAGVDPEAGWVWFTAHVEGPFERHLYRARLDGSTASEPERVSVEPGWHDPAFAPTARRYLDTWARAVKPPSVAVHDAASGERIAWIEENPAGDLVQGLVEPEFVWLDGVADDDPAPGDSLPAAIYRPADFDPGGSYPVLVYTYGGPGAQVAKDDWLTRGRGLWHQMMVDRGFLVFSCDGRGSGARGKAWVETVHRRLGSLETADQAACVRALWEAVPAADPERTGIWGWSFGGYMAANALVREGETWAAAAAIAPVSDWRDYDTAYTERYMETPQANPEGYDETAPVNVADRMDDPFFLAWGQGDDNVHPVHSVRLVDALIAAGHPVETHVFPGRGHAIGDPPARILLFGALTDFFERTLHPER